MKLSQESQDKFVSVSKIRFCDKMTNYILLKIDPAEKDQKQIGMKKIWTWMSFVSVDVKCIAV